MTPQEAALQYGTLSVRVYSGLTITDVARNLYQSDSEFYQYIIKSLNHLVSWYPVSQDIEILYIDPAYTNSIDAPIY